MKTEVTVETEKPAKLKTILEPSLTSDKKVNYNFQEQDRELKISVETDGLGPLRGCTDTIFRLTTLANKTYFQT